MKSVLNWQIGLAVILVALSVVFYVFHYLVFGDIRHIFLYLIGDIAFLFIDVMIVTLVLNRLLVYREKQSIFKKLNVVIDAFFSEVGTDLLNLCLKFDSSVDSFRKKLVIEKDWSDRYFLMTKQSLQSCGSIDSKRFNLGEVRTFLISKRPFLLTLLENPNLVEHESFTNLLLSILHLTDELENRHSFAKLPESDFKHLSDDIKRVYNQLILEWLDYMRHLKKDYPYLFSLALRINPFDENASVEIADS
jgi:hypothetical protein